MLSDKIKGVKGGLIEIDTGVLIEIKIGCSMMGFSMIGHLFLFLRIQSLEFRRLGSVRSVVVFLVGKPPMVASNALRCIVQTRVYIRHSERSQPRSEI